MSKANSWSWSFFPFSFQKILHSHEPLVRMQITRRSTFESTLFCNRHAVFSSVNSSQKSFRPHFMIFLGRHRCPKTSFCLSPRKRWKPFAEPCWNASDNTSLSVETCNSNKVLPINPLRLYPFMVYSFQFTAFLHIRCIYTVETRNMKSWYE